MSWYCKQMFEAVRRGDLQALKTLVEVDHCDVNIRDDFGMTPLHLAVIYKNLDMIRYLISHGANPEAKNNVGLTPIDLALGNQQIVSMLRGGVVAQPEVLTPQPSVSSMNVGSTSDDAIAPKTEECDELLREWRYSPLNGHEWIVELVKAKGCDVNRRNVYKQTPLHLASKRGNLEAVKTLVELGADVNALDDAGVTPLLYALINGHKDVAKYLIDHGANPNLYSLGNPHRRPGEVIPLFMAIGQKMY